MTQSTACKQTTLGDIVEFNGIGVHSGAPVSMTLYPAEADTGIVFTRSDLCDDIHVKAHHGSVAATELCTVIGDPTSAGVATVEHLMAALAGLGVDNCIVELDGPEVAIMDGSAAPFVAAIKAVGLRRQRLSRRCIKILKPVRVEVGDGFAELLPQDYGFTVDVTIEFPTRLIGRQQFVIDVTPQSFERELCRARTFGFTRDLEQLLAAGYALGASLDNTVALGEDRILNPEGLRYANEFVRHKALDAVGDLALAGAPLIGRFRSYRGGHKINFRVLQALFATRGAWDYVTAPQARRPARQSEAAVVMQAAAAFSPDMS
jgi:UDP-3-O-[3-hydroxymyristoyl] N-acetylglucosamine deacetylase